MSNTLSPSLLLEFWQQPSTESALHGAGGSACGTLLLGVGQNSADSIAVLDYRVV